MEIRIHSGGRELGPYPEPQVRQYLADGLILGTDPAFVEGMTDWLPLEHLLAQLPAPEAPSAPAPVAETSAETVRTVRVQTSALPKLRRGPIVLQPLNGTEGDPPKRPRSGKTAVTIEAPRPTTQLPPVAKFVPKEERKPAKNALDTHQLAPSHFFQREPTDSTPLPTEPVELTTTTAPPLEAELIAPAEPMVSLAVESAPAVEPAPPLEPTPAPSPAPAPMPELQAPVPPAVTLAESTPAKPPAENPAKPKKAFSFKNLFAGLTGLFVVVMLAFFIRYFGAPPSFPITPVSSTGTAAAIPAPAAPAQTSASADLYQSGFALQQKGDLDDAMADYDKAIALDPRNAEALYRRAVARQTKGNWQGALDDYNVLLALSPDNTDAFSNRGYVKQALGDFDGALADYTQALARKPAIAEAWFNVGLIKVKRGDIDGGIAAYNKALDLNPKLAHAYYNRGNAKNSEGDLDGAIADYTQAIDLEPTNAMACLNRGTARQARGDSAGALADYSQAIADDAQLTQAYRARAGVEALRGDLAAANTDASKALDLEPTDPSPLFTLGLAQLGLHNLDMAEADFEKYCAAAPHSTDCDTARLYLWVIAAEQNTRDKADDDLANALLNNWNSVPEDLTSKIADFLVGHIREDELISAASTPDPKLEPGRFCRVWYFAGIKRMITGDTATALDYFQKSLSTGQNNFCEYVFAHAQIVSLGQARQASSPPSAHVP